jgi:carbamoylphosphate synthase large subunit
MKRLLIAGGSYSDIPLIKEAKKQGYYVITSGNRESDLGHKYSDECHLVDFSDKDSMLRLAQELNIDAIIPSCHDLSMVTSSYVANTLGICNYDSYETTLTLHHKDRFKELAQSINLKTPKAISMSDINEYDAIVDKVTYPSIIKPIDLGGGKGISVVNNQEELKRAIEYAFDYSVAKKIVIEEFVNGTLQSFNCFIKNQKVIFCFGDNEHSNVNKYGVSTSTSPSKNFDNVKDAIIEQVELLSSKLELRDGLLHLQYLMDNNDIYIIEFTRRLSGDWYGIPVELSTSMPQSHAYWVLQGFLGQSLEQLHYLPQKGYYSRHCLMSKSNGKSKKIYIDDSIKDNIVDSLVWYDNDEVVDFVNQKFGLYFLRYDSVEEMEEKTRKINDLITVEME